MPTRHARAFNGISARRAFFVPLSFPQRRIFGSWAVLDPLQTFGLTSYPSGCILG
jgi:hypothetical protein